MNDLEKRALGAIEGLSRCFLDEGDTSSVLEEILTLLQDKLGYRHGVVSLFDEESQSLLIEAATGVSREAFEQVRYKRGEGITGLILSSKSSLSIRRIGQDPRFLNRLGIHNPEEAFLGVPILKGKKALGVLTCTLDAKERHSLDEHLRLAQTLANLIAAVVLRLHKQETETQKVKKEQDQLKQVLKKKFNPAGMVGQSAAMMDVFEQVAQVAIWDSTVLIRGESGTGKELIAKAIHFHSPRVNGPLVKLNCAALPDNLLESELFGYEKGAFTGANKTKPGRFEMADGGTIFLDEIGDTSMPFQAKLLRVLQEGEFERLGGEATMKVNLRVITATHVDLEKAVSEGRFREDLYYRLNVMPIFIPPLRERREDIAPLTEFFLKGLSAERGQDIAINTSTLEVISQCDFPGNVRELENCLRRAAMTSKDFMITEDALPCTRGLCLSRTIQHHVELPVTQTTQQQAVVNSEPEMELSKIANERDRVTAALQRAGWVQAKAARLLHMTPRQVAYRIQKLKIDLEEF